MKSRFLEEINKKFTKLLDWYFAFPLTFDFIFFGIVYVLLIKCVSWNFFALHFNRETMNNLLNELVSSSFSIAGFVLAGLTVLMGLKESTRNLGPEQKPKSGVELFFNSELYDVSVKIFFKACVIFVFLFLGFSFIELFNQWFTDDKLFYALLFGVVMCTLTTFRVLYVLMRVFRLQTKKRK